MTTKPKETEPKDTIDWKLATVRQNCLNEAVKARPDNPVPLANEMYRFVIGEPIVKTILPIAEAILNKPETTKEWK